MQKIIATIQQNEAGLAVANLQDALFAMMKHGYISAMPAGERPTEKDLQKLAEKLKDEQTQSVYGESTTQLVFYFQLQNGLGDVLRGVGVDDKTADKLNEFLKKEGLLDADDTYSVQGVVNKQTGKPLKAYFIKAYDRDLRKEQPLGEQAITDASGFYQIKYSPKEFLAGDAVSAAPDLLVRVFDQNNQLIAQSPIRFNASRHEVVDFTIDVKEDKPAEWSHLCEVILPLLAGEGHVKPVYTHGHHDAGMATDLLPSELTAEDIDFIVKDTGLDIALVQAWIAAYAMQKEAIAELNEVSSNHLEAMQKNGWEFFYAFSSLGVALHLKQACSLTNDKQERTWANALSGQKVSEIAASQLKILFDALPLLGKLKQLDPIQSPENPFTKLLWVTAPEMPKDLALKLMPLFESQDNQSVKKILELRNDDNKTHINRLVQGVRLQDRLGYAPNVIKGLMSHLGDDTDTIDDLVKIPTSAYLDMAKQQNMGTGEAYAVQNKVELINPVLAIQSRLKSKELTLDGSLKTAFTKFLDDEPEAAEKIIQGKAKIGKNAKDHEKALKTIGTVMNLGGTIGIANHLITNNINDIAALARKGKDFLNTHFIDVPTEELDVIKVDVIDKANRFVNAGLDWSMDRPIRVPSWWLEELPQPTPAQRENLPTLPGFFGDLDECMCKPCESMLGQPAYLVDLLMLLSQSDAAFNEFSQRRGDILTLELTCENAEKEVQHIDLALRILEKTIPNISLPSQLPADDEAIEAAYVPLSTTAYPWALPFDLKLTELRHYLAKLNINLLDIWRLVGSVTNEQKAAEILGLHSLSTAANPINDWNLISAVGLPANTDIWQRYGLSAGNVSLIDPASAEKLQNQPVSDVLKRVSVLLDRTGLTLDEFERVIATGFVKGTGNLIIDDRDKCKTSQMRLNTGSQSIDSVLGRLQQFVRLYKRIGVWSIETLDALIQLVGGGLLPTTGSNARTPLLEIAEFKAFADTFLLPIDSLVDAIKTPANQDVLLPHLNLTKAQFELLKILPQPTGSVSAFTTLKRVCELANQMAEVELPIELIAKSILDDDALTTAGYTTEASKSVQAITDFKAELKLATQQATKLDDSLSLTDNALLIMAKIVGDKDAKRVVSAILKAAEKKENTPDAIPDAQSAKDKIKPILQQNRAFGQLKINILDTELAKIFDVKATSNDALEPRLTELIKSVSGVLREQALILTLVNQFGISEQDSVALLTNRLPLSSANAQHANTLLLSEKFIGNGSFTPAETEQLATWFAQLFKLDHLTKALGFDTQTMKMIDAIKVGSSQFNWNKLLASKTDGWQAHWEELKDFIWLGKEKQFGKQQLFTLLREDFTQAKQTIANRFDLPKTKTEELLTYAGITAVDKLYQASLLRKAFNLCLLAKKLGANKAQLEKLVNTSDMPQAVTVVLELLQAKSTPSEWALQKQKYKDSIRKARRDAIVAYHLSLKNSASADRIWKENDLYEYYLIDPMMQACMKTTKVVEAIMAIQLFTQRVLFGLEPNIRASDELKQRWTWMRNYRVWEANRKVFLFPENWLYPELRDDKSSSFKLLESTLGQGELNEESAKEAFGQFLDDVAQMGQVEVLGMYEDISLNSNGTVEIVNGLPRYRVLYVIGRTLNPPYRYYWRKCTDFGSRFMEWSPWQHIELDIQGDHVMPFVLGGDFHIAWPVIKFQHHEAPETSEWHINLAWSRYDGRSWKKTNVSREIWKGAALAFADERWGFAFRCETSISKDKVTILGYSLNDREDEKEAKSETSFSEYPYSFLFDNIAISEALEYPFKLSKSDISLLIANSFDQPLLGIPVEESFINFNAVAKDNDPNDCLDVKKHLHLYYTQKHFTTGAHYPGIDRARRVFERPSVEYKDHMIQYRDWPDVRNISPSDNALKSEVANFISSFNGYLGNNLVDKSFNKLLTKLNVNTSLRIIDCKAWIRIKTSTGGSGLKEITGNSGQFSCLIQGENFELKPNGKKINMLRLGNQPEIEIDLKLSLNIPNIGNRSLTSKKEKLLAVNSGRLKNITLHFEFNSEDITNQEDRQKFLSELGIDLITDRSLILTSKFELSLGNVLNVFDKQTPLLINSFSNASPWMNGYLETLQAGAVQTIKPIEISGTKVIDPTPLGQFWVVNAATSENNQSKIWHFSDTGYRGYIDLASTSTQTQKDLLIYADAYTDPLQYQRKWISENLLDQTELAEGGFSSRYIHSVINDNNTKIWLATHDEKLAKNLNLEYIEDLSFVGLMPYACYNWEIFFHAPLMIADQLSKQQKFEEAEHWLRYIFDPTSTEPGTDAKRFLKFRVFKELDTNQQVIDDLTALSQTASGYYTAADTERVQNLIRRWRERPFRPFVIARGRHIAFLWRTLFSYLDNLLAWADSLYRRDTRESINEALMLYALAMKILGRKPKKQAGKSKKKAIHFNQFVDQWDDFANFWIDVGAPHNQYVQAYASDIKSIKPRPTSAGMLAFCMPFNDKILNYWDTVEARLFNIRHCQNIEGIERILPLSDPPIDPELLIRATAAGLDIGSVIAGLYAPPPHYRYGTLANRATELANDVKALGSSLLSAFEKRDAEGLALLRGTNEINLLKLVTDLRNLQINEAEKNLEALRASRRSVATRYYQYQRLMGKKDIKVPIEGETAGEESMLGTLDEGLASGRSGLGLIHEENEVYTGIKAANDWSTAANITKLAGSLFYFGEAVALAIPDPSEKTAKTLKAFGQGTSLVGDGFSFVSQAWRSYADQQSMLAGHLRRRDEWAFQSNQTLKELQQIDKQILANQVRIEITRKELSNHIEQLEQAQAIDEVMRSKFTNQQLYEWMSRELSSLYDKTYRLAIETARKAERAAERELGMKALNVIRHDYWDSMKQGLLAGERLYHDLKRLEVTYLEQNRRELELTKHVSLRRLNPDALIQLRKSEKDDDGNKINQCEFEIPEWLFDLDTPGHFLRRIKSVSVSIPCVVGPYTSINCKLTLLNSSIRRDKNTQPKYEKSDDDPRFTYYYGASEAIVTSTANADSGMFETQLRDERFLPFEGSGAISTWRLELPADYPQFDYSTISDVILSIRYTARDGGLELSKAALQDINSKLTIT
ncbi:MAG: neuraminidase-like domain-containing protein [Methylotenera sp.]